MADMEVLAPGGHQHLVGKIKEQLDLKADAAMADAVDKVARNQVTREVEGEIISIDDAYGAPMLSLVVDGKSTQVSTTGVQMLNDATSTRGYRTNQNGNPIAASSYSMSDYIPVDASTAYYFVNMVGSQNGYTLCEYDSEKTFIQYQTIYGTTSAVGTRTTSETTAYIIVSYATANADTAMVSKGTTATPYEPYTGGNPAPSPDYPQPIKSVDALSMNFSMKNILRAVDVTLGANLAIIDGAFAYTGAGSWNAGSKTYVVSDDGRFNNSNNYLGQPRLRNYPTYARRIARGTYTFGFTQTGEMTAALRVGTLSEDGLYVQNGTTFEVTGDDWYYILVVQLSNRTTNTTTYLYQQLVAGSTLGVWEPYAGTTFPLYDGTLRSLPDGTKDTLALTYLRPSTREGWAVYGAEVTRAATIITAAEFAANTHWSKSSNALNGYYVDCHYFGVKENASGNLTCNMYNAASSVNDYYANYGRVWGDRYINFNTDPAICGSTIADFKAWLATTNLVLLAPLATPTTETLDPIELPVLPAPNATAYSDPATGLAIEYVRDTELVIDSLYAEIDRAHAAIAPVEHGTSSANYAVGSYLMLDGTFCKVTSAIATGETIVIGTNVVATTVDAELASLA